MREIFYEETVLNVNYNKQKIPYTIFRLFGIVSALMSILWFITYLFSIDFASRNLIINILIAIIPAIIFFVCFVIFLRLSNSFCVEYDYVMINNTLSFSKIIKNNRRTNLYEIDVKSIEKIGLYGSENYLRYKNTPDVKIQFLTPNNVPQGDNIFIYLYLTYNSKKKILVLETGSNLLKYMKIYLNAYAIDEEISK